MVLFFGLFVCFLLHFGSKIMITAVIVVYGAVTVYVGLS